MNSKPGISSLVAAILAAAAMALPAQALAEEHEFDEAQLYFELNDTDGDLGIHGLIDGDAWKRLAIVNPVGQPLMRAWIRGELRQQGLTEFFFESAEPPFDELAPADFFARFPEGEYAIEGVTLDGGRLEGDAELSHVMAAAPGDVTVNSEAAAEDCDAGLPEVAAPVTIGWSAVTMSHDEIGTPGMPVTVDKYELVAEIEREDAEEGPEVLVFKADLLPADDDGPMSFELPGDFLAQAKGEVKFEIITRLDSGNQTAIESCFELDGGD